MNKRKAKRLVLVVLLAASVLLPAGFYFWRTPQPSPARAQPLAGVEISVLASMDEDIAAYLCDAFAQATGCKVSLVCLPVQQAVRLILDGQAQADVLLGGTAQAHRQLREAGKLLRIPADETALARFYVDLEHVWTPVTADLFAIGINTALMEDQSLPDTLEALAQPQYRGRITMADPTTSYTALALPFSILRLYGEQKGMQLLEAIWSNVGEFAQTDLVAAQKAAQGLYPITLGLYSGQQRMTAAGYTLASVVYSGAGWTVAPLSMLSVSDQPQLARAFRDFCLDGDVLDTAAALGHSLSPLSGAAVTIQDYPVSGAARVYSDYAKQDSVMALYRAIIAENPQMIFPVSRAPVQ